MLQMLQMFENFQFFSIFIQKISKSANKKQTKNFYELHYGIPKTQVFMLILTSLIRVQKNVIGKKLSAKSKKFKICIVFCLLLYSEIFFEPISKNMESS